MNASSDTPPFQRAVALALDAERAGNLPIGAVITLGDQVIAEGKNAIWQPSYSGTHHAEIEALGAVPEDLWNHAPAMTLYSTLEPCVMCTGAILLHRIGRVVFGATDALGGGSGVLKTLPPYMQEVLTQTAWVGPAFQDACEPLYHRVLEAIRRRQAAGLII